VKEIFQDMLAAFKEVVATWDGFQQYISNIDNLVQNVAAIGQKEFVPNTLGQGYNVLNHADFHLRNILVKKTPEKRIEDALFV
jgi:mRNA-degrading endonuclease HigB of HigAB toxin-antitoxin module